MLYTLRGYRMFTHDLLHQHLKARCSICNAHDIPSHNQAQDRLSGMVIIPIRKACLAVPSNVVHDRGITVIRSSRHDNTPMSSNQGGRGSIIKRYLPVLEGVYPSCVRVT